MAPSTRLLPGANGSSESAPSGLPVLDPSHGADVFGGVWTLPAAEIVPITVEWLWPLRVPSSTLTLLAGDPGLGKSLLTIDLAARLSRGEFGGAGVGLIATAEDLPAATVVPRLMAAGADLTRVHVTCGLERLPKDVDALTRNVVGVGASLVVIDPLMAFLSPGDVDAYKDQSIRVALARLQEMAEQTGAAVVLVAHLNKGQDADPLRRIAGSVGLQAAVRSILLLARDPSDPGGDTGSQRVLAHVKSSLADQQPSIRYTVESLTVGADPIETARIVSQGCSQLTAAELLTPAPEPGSQEAEAMQLLTTARWRTEDGQGTLCRCRRHRRLQRDAQASKEATRDQERQARLRRRMGLATPDDQRDARDRVSPIPREARDGLMRAWLQILKERHPAVMWVPTLHESAGPERPELTERAAEDTLLAGEPAAAAFSH